MAQEIHSAKGEDASGVESRGSLAPLLSSDSSAVSESDPAMGADPAQTTGDGENGSKPRKRDFWKFGKKGDEDLSKGKAKPPDPFPPVAAKSTSAHIAAIRPISPLRNPPETLRASASPQRNHPYVIPSSPGQGLHSSSPRMHSPASSQIFERNVQEDVMPPQASAQIPSHILTENHIPPALDGASAAITSKLSPDDVEIVTHADHQPAAVTITGAGMEQSMSSSLHGDFDHMHRQDADNTSNYATLDNADVRRLSFISFADVVHAEHAEHVESGEQLASRRDSAHPPSTLGQSSILAPRSPSPMRSPVSSHGLGTSPPSSVSPSFQGLEASPSRGGRGPGSPLPGQMSPLGGELNIETMRQALRKTGSGDLSGARSQPLSAVGNDDGTFPDKDIK